MNYIKSFLPIFFILLFTGCFTTNQLVLPDRSKELIELPIKIESLSIVDKRDTLLPMNWDLPLIVAKATEWKGNPEMSELNRSDIEQLITQSENVDGIPANIEFSVIEGLCKLTTVWNSVKEYAKFNGSIEVEIPSQNITYTLNAEMFYENSTFDASEEGAVKLYNQAVKDVTHILLKQLKKNINLQIDNN